MRRRRLVDPLRACDSVRCDQLDASGKIDAVYLNPQPINIATAEATRDGSTVKVFVELRAPNYPGSTYTLTYDQEHDQLRGIYFQAVEQQSFNIFFVRMK